MKIGVLNDMSSLYADIGGPNSVAAVEMAVEDSGLPAKGWKIDVLSGDHQNKPDIGTNIARQWIDNERVDVISDTPNSGVALAVTNLVKEKNIVHLNSGAATADLTGKACTPNTISFTYDTYMLANGTGKALTKAGGDSWFFLTADYASAMRWSGHHGRCDRQWRQGAGRRQASAQHLGLLFLPAAGAGLEGEGRRARQCRRRHHQLDQAGSEFGIAPAARNSPRCCSSSPTCIRWAEDRTGPDFHGILLLGHEQQDPRMVETLRKVSPKGAMPSMTVAGLCRRTALSEGDGSARRQCS